MYGRLDAAAYDFPKAFAQAPSLEGLGAFQGSSFPSDTVLTSVNYSAITALLTVTTIDLLAFPIN
jgi:hypothetical protein